MVISPVKRASLFFLVGGSTEISWPLLPCKFIFPAAEISWPPGFAMFPLQIWVLGFPTAVLLCAVCACCFARDRLGGIQEEEDGNSVLLSSDASTAIYL